MEKQKRVYLTLLLCLGLLFITNLILHVLNVYKWWIFGILFFTLGVLIFFSVYKLLKIIKLIKEKKEEQTKVKPTGNYNVDLYAVLGIPVQYNKDGSVKDIYELLGVDPIFDENGNRILTIYELLKIMPRFDNNGKEIPTVTVIKNRVGRIAKVDVSDRVLTRKLTDEEKEALAIREMLKEKLKEAEKQGDIEKQKAIKSVIKSNSKKETPPEVSVPKSKIGSFENESLKNIILKSGVGNNTGLSDYKLYEFFLKSYRDNLEKEKNASRDKVVKVQQEPVKANKEEANKNIQEEKHLDEQDNLTKRFSSNVSVIIEEELTQ